MAAILDRWVPSRRLERKRQRALQESLDARFGDTHITAPTEGAWNQIGSEADKGNISSPVDTGGWSPDLSVERPWPETRMSMENVVEDSPVQKDSQKHNFTITIPLPWASRKPHTRTSSMANSTMMTSTTREEQPELSPISIISSPEPTPRSFVSLPDPNSKSNLSSPNTTLQSQATSPVVIYKPVSEEYKQQLAEMAKGISRVDSPPSLPPDRAQSASPTNIIYKPATEGFVREMAELGMGPSPAIPHRETVSRPRAPSKPTPVGLPLDPRPTPINHSPALPTVTIGLPPDPRPTPVSRSPELQPGPMGLPVQPHAGTTRSASRGPPAERIGTTRSASRDPASERAGTTRSSSRGPAVERRRTTRSASQGPSFDRLPITRSTSRGPFAERSGNGCHGRSSSRGPVSKRIPYRESASSDSSAGSGITTSSSPTFNNSFTTITTIASNTTTDNNNIINAALPTTMKTTERNGSVGSATGYYVAAAQDYKRIASEVEDSEYEKRRVRELDVTTNSKRSNKKEKQREREKNLQGPQEMVPNEDELW